VNIQENPDAVVIKSSYTSSCLFYLAKRLDGRGIHRGVRVLMAERLVSRPNFSESGGSTMYCTDQSKGYISVSVYKSCHTSSVRNFIEGVIVTI
jgi:hypothetical protein